MTWNLSGKDLPAAPHFLLANERRYSGINRSRHFRRKEDSSVIGKRVLLFSANRELALYRADVLRNSGFVVLFPTSNEEAVSMAREAKYDVAVFSYTLSIDLVHELAQLVREYSPGCPLVAVSDSGLLDRKIDPNAVVLADDGPDALIQTLRRLTS